MNAHAPKRVPAPGQIDLFGDVASAASAPGPEGFRYQADLIDAGEEAALAGHLEGLPFEPFDFHGHLANRRVVGFGYRYDYASRTVRAADPIPSFLEPLRRKISAFAGLPPEAFEQVLINRYRPGAGIGWHRDKPHFEHVVGVSLLAPCTFRFRNKIGERWDRLSIPVASRSAYLMTGPSRHIWEHAGGVPLFNHDAHSFHRTVLSIFSGNNLGYRPTENIVSCSADNRTRAAERVQVFRLIQAHSLGS